MQKVQEKIDCMDAESVDKLKQNLRDSYMHMRDLTSRCMIDLSAAEKNDRRIFYFKPESVLLKDPETQKNFRENLIKNISQPPKIIDQPSLASDLTKEATEQLKDLSEPDSMRVFLADHFQRRAYNLQHKKYKVLLRWAHFALTSEYLERIGHHGTYTYGRIQYELENSIKRHDRLAQDDDYGALRDEKIKKPRAKGEKDEEGEFSNNLYTEKEKKDPLSCLRMDDFEIYLRTQTYEMKLYRVPEKFISRLKYLPMAKHYDILKESRVLIQDNREKYFQESRLCQQNVRQRFQASIMKKTDDLIIQMEEILERTFPCNFVLKEEFRILAPTRIQNIFELQTDILKRASIFNITGDIEIDDGHSFTYQVHVFFTMYFQRQIIKSQFSVYDQTVRDMKDSYESNEAPDEDLGDINEIERRNLNSLLLIDYQMVDLMNSNSDQNNLFLLKKGKKILDQIHELKKNFTDMIVIRLKKAYWLDAVIMRPKIDNKVKEQQAIFNQDYLPDLLLQSIQELIDMNDISTINTVYSDLTHIQAEVSVNQNIMGDQHQQLDNRDIFEQINNLVKSSQLQDESAQQLLVHFGNALKQNIKENTFEQKKKTTTVKDVQQKFKNSILKILPQHFLQSYHILRHLRTKDTKTKLLYTLNFFRAVQKRIALDLREFAGREIVSQNVDNKPAYEATYIGNNSKVINNNLFFKNMNTMMDDKQKDTELRFQVDPEEAEQDKNSMMKNLVDLKKWKYKNKFNYMMLNTCPIMPPFHSKHGEPVDDKFMQPDFTDFKSTSKMHITNKSTYLLTRMDTIKVDTEKKEIYVVDDYGMYLMFDCSLDDMNSLDKELLKISTYYVKKNEAEFDFRAHQFPMIDRFQVLEDLYDYEFQYQYSKAQLLISYLEAFEHICDPLEQQRIMQVMTDLMAQRPRLDYKTSTYFIESYRAEIHCMETHLKLVKEITSYLMVHERKCNKYIRDYLQVAYRLTNEYTNKKWTDTQQEDILKEVKQRQVVQGGMRFQDIQLLQEQLKQEEDALKPDIEETGNEDAVGGTDMFAEMLGLKDMSVENVMNNAKNDEAVEDLMAQDSNFIKTQEGYPFFLKEQNGKQSVDTLSRIKFTDFSNEVGVLDFYESLSIIPKICAAIETIFDELQSEICPSNNIELVSLQTIYFEKCYVEFKKCQIFSNEERVEYQGSNLIENDLIMQSPDKIMFLIKDMVGHITRTYKKNINPFFVSKLDLFTINHFSFPEIAKSTMQNSKLGRLDVNFSRDFIETQLQSGGAQARFFPKLREDDRKINVPPLLLVFCNLVEVMRLRECLILNITETVALQDIYNDLKDMANRSNFRLIAQTPLQFQNVDGFSRDQLNYFDDGALTQLDVDLAINEFDLTLRSNLNFMNSESLQCLVLDGGLVEIRAVNHYQLMQKQILLVATKANFYMMHQHRRALAEIELFQQHRIKIAGSIIDYESLYKQVHAHGGYVICDDLIKALKNRILVQTAQHNEHSFMPIMPMKEFLRGRIEKKQREMLLVVQNVTIMRIEGHGKDSLKQYPLNPESVARLNRENRIALLHCYCTQIMKMNLVNGMKIQAMVESLKIKRFMNVFPKEIHVMKMQKSEQYDLMHKKGHFSPSNHSTFEDSYLYSNFEDGFLNSMITIPSIKTLITLESMTFEDKRTFEKSIFDQIESLDYNLKPIQKDKLEKIYLKSRQRLLITSLCSYLDRSILLAIENSVPGRTFQNLKFVKGIMDLLFFQAKLNMSRAETIRMLQSADAYEEFWDHDENSEGDDQFSVNQDKKISDFILKKMVNDRRKKQALQDELQDLAKSLGEIFKSTEQYSALQITSANTYLSKQLSLIQQKLLTALLSVLESFYLQKKSPEIIGAILECIQDMTKLEMNVPIYCHNGFAVHQHNVSGRSRYLGVSVKKDFDIFNRSVKGIQLEKEIVDPAILMLEEIFQQPVTTNHRSNYSGQMNSKSWSINECLSSLIIGLEKNEIRYLNTVMLQLDSNSREYTISTNPKFTGEVNQPECLQKQCNFLEEIAKSKILLFSISIVLAQSSLPLNWKVYQDHHSALYQKEIGWKVEEEYQRKFNMTIIQERKDKEDKQSKTSTSANISDAKVSKLARELQDEAIQNEFKVKKHQNMQRDLLMQQIKQNRIMTKSLIKVSTRQIDMILIKMGYDAVSNQVSSISKCLEMASSNLDQRLIQNWDNFAPTLADHNPKIQRHMDPLNRIGEMQTWLTRMKNRGMDIETLTSGPGVVFSYKDLNDCLQTFATKLVSYAEKEFKNRTQSSQVMINHLQHLVYIKDTRVEGLKSKLRMMHDNITRIVNAKVYEKGNGLIFELDRGLREAKFYKDHINEFEEQMKDFVKDEFRKQLLEKDLEINISKKHTYDVINNLISEFKEFSTKKEIENIEKIKIAKDRALLSGSGFIIPMSQSKDKTPSESFKGARNEGKQNNLSSKNTQMNNITTEAEERITNKLLKTQGEVIKLQKLLIKQRTLWIFKQQTQRLRYEDENEILKKKLTSNQALWDQMLDSDKKTKILQQELIFTQKSLSQCEKIIEKLKEELKLSEQERMRLFQYKQNKAQRLDELEDQVKKMDISDQVNITKIIDQLQKKDRELSELKIVEKNFNQHVSKQDDALNKKDNQWQRKLNKEVEIKKQAMVKLSDLQSELKALEQGNKDISNSDNGGIWKSKCKELYEICRGLAEENTDLLSMIKNQQLKQSSQNETKQTGTQRKSGQNFYQDQSQIQNKTRNLKESQTILNGIQPTDSSKTFDYGILPTHSTRDLNNMFSFSPGINPNSSGNSNSFLRSLKQQQYNEQISKTNRPFAENVYQNKTHIQSIMLSKSAQRMNENQYQSSSSTDIKKISYDNQGVQEALNSEYSDMLSYGGLSGVNDFSLFSNVHPIKPIISVEDQNRRTGTQFLRSNVNSSTQNYLISKSNSQQDDSLRANQQSVKLLVKGVNTQSANPYQQAIPKITHQLRSAQRVALGRMVVLTGSSNAHKLNGISASPIDNKRGQNNSSRSVEPQVLIFQNNEENAGLLLQGNKMNQAN